MWRSKKFIVGAVLATVLLAGSLGGIALANEGEDDNGADYQPGMEFLERLAGKLGIDVQELIDKIGEVREELPERDGERWHGKRGPAGCFGNLAERLGIEVDDEALRAAMEQVRARIMAGEDGHEVMAEVLAGLGIDLEELKAACTEDGEGPFEHGFHGMGGMRGFGGWHIQVE